MTHAKLIQLRRLERALNELDPGVQYKHLDHIVVPGLADKPEIAVFRFEVERTNVAQMPDEPDEFVIPAPKETEALLQFFNFDHLPDHLKSISRPFSEIAETIMKLPRNPERTTALRKLLEAKDCAVRARLMK